MNEFPSYRLRYCAFLDILGFKELVERSLTSSKILKEIFSILRTAQTIRWRGHHFSHGDSSLKVTSFSDCIVASTELSPSGLKSVMTLAEAFTADVLHLGAFTRGGITSGHLIHTRDEVFGPALNEAYRMESKEAIVPRIILDKSVASDLSIAGQYEYDFQDTCRIDVDGRMYVNVFRELAQQLREAKFNWAGNEYYLNRDVIYCRELRDRLATLISSGPSDKMDWFAEAWNREMGHETFDIGKLLSPLSGAPNDIFKGLETVQHTPRFSTKHVERVDTRY